jgi:hypothetical protein
MKKNECHEIKISAVKEITRNGEATGWYEARAMINTNPCSLQAKIYDEGSDYGIDEGRVSKLSVKLDHSNCLLVDYDRGFGVEPTTFGKTLASELAKKLETLVKVKN